MRGAGSRGAGSRRRRCRHRFCCGRRSRRRACCGGERVDRGARRRVSRGHKERGDEEGKRGCRGRHPARWLQAFWGPRVGAERGAARHGVVRLQYRAGLEPLLHACICFVPAWGRKYVCVRVGGEEGISVLVQGGVCCSSHTTQKGCVCAGTRAHNPRETQGRHKCSPHVKIHGQRPRFQTCKRRCARSLVRVCVCVCVCVLSLIHI